MVIRLRKEGYGFLGSLFSLKRLSAVPSFFRWVVAGAGLASLLALYRMSGVPSFLVGAAPEAGFEVGAVAGFTAVVVVAGLAGVAAVAGVVAVLGATWAPLGFAFFAVVCDVASCAKLNPAKDNSRPAIKRILFITGKILVFLQLKLQVNLFQYTP